MYDVIISNLIKIAAVAITAIITGVVLPLISSWLKSKVNNQKWANAIDDVTVQVSNSVDYLEQTLVKQLKEDGKWNTDTQKEVLNEAVTAVMNNLSADTLKYLQENVSDMTAYITQCIESKILNSKDE